jgi:hypothetical protein
LRPPYPNARLGILGHAPTDSALAPLCHLRHGLRPDRRRALELLAACQDGCTEAIMLAQGFTGLARATTERVVAGGKSIEVARVKIIEAVRQATRVQLHSWRLAEESYGD